MLDLNEYDIDRRCGYGLTEAGRRYHKQARVLEFSREGDTIAVGTLISERPPHRTERAQFGHSAPTSGV